ncbi:MAG TPA: sulfatase, partial [Polyangiaceae bacterium]|nr:sulfatase [Polyangiaceae bacterium]
LLLALLLAVCSCRRGASKGDEQLQPPQAEHPAVPAQSPATSIQNVVLITVDTLRADQPWVGYQNVATPYLSRLAAKSVVYTRAYALAHFTTASLNGLLASRFPSELSRSDCDLGRYDIPESLAPTLKAAGIKTFAAHGHAIFVGDSAPRNGFDEWRVIYGAAGRMQTRGAVTGVDIARLVTTYLENDRPKMPLFAWAHFVDPHDSYVAHERFPPRGKQPRDVYDSEVAFTDAAIGSILESIERSGLANSTAIVLTADHGEAFGEHGSTKHGSTLYEEEVRVPLILHLPGVEPRTIGTARSAVDIAPTIAEILRVDIPKSWAGVSLLRDLTGAPLEERPVIVDVPSAYSRPPRQAVIRGQTKVIFEGGSDQVFDLAADPEERRPLPDDAAKGPVELAREDLKRVQSIAGTACGRAKSSVPRKEAL